MDDREELALSRAHRAASRAKRHSTSDCCLAWMGVARSSLAPLLLPGERRSAEALCAPCPVAGEATAPLQRQRGLRVQFTAASTPVQPRPMTVPAAGGAERRDPRPRRTAREQPSRSTSPCDPMPDGAAERSGYPSRVCPIRRCAIEFSWCPRAPPSDSDCSCGRQAALLSCMDNARSPGGAPRRTRGRPVSGRRASTSQGGGTRPRTLRRAGVGVAARQLLDAPCGRPAQPLDVLRAVHAPGSTGGFTRWPRGIAWGCVGRRGAGGAQTWGDRPGDLEWDRGAAQGAR